MPAWDRPESGYLAGGLAFLRQLAPVDPAGLVERRARPNRHRVAVCQA